MQNNKSQDLNLQLSKKELKNFGLIWSAIFFVIATSPLFAGHSIKSGALLVSFLFSSISSFVWGYDVNQDERFTDHLQKKFKNKFNIYNFGVSGFGNDQEFCFCKNIMIN